MLSLAMICKDELENLKRLKPLLKDIDEWVVVLPPNDPAEAWAKKNVDKVIVKDFTQEIEPEIREQMLTYGINVHEDYRLFNFAAARNESFKHATGDYVLWLDADDTPIGLENIKKYIESYEADVYEAVYDYYRDEEGNSVSDHIRERVVKNNGKLEWVGSKLGLIHETLLPKKNYNPTVLTIEDDIFRVEHNSDHIEDSSIRNHVALLYEYIKTNGEDPRTTFYLGLEFFNRKNYQTSIKTFLEYVQVGGSIEDRHQAWTKVAEAYNFIGDNFQSRKAYYEAMKEMPQRPDAYLGIGETYFEDGEYAKAIDFMMTGLTKKLPQSKQAIDPMKYTFRPSGYIAQSYLKLDQPKEAFDWFTRTAQLNPKHPWVQEYAPLFVEAKELDEYVRSFVKLGQIAQKKYPQTLSKLADSVPDAIMGQEILLDFKRRYTKPKIWSDKSVVIFCSEAFEDWGPESLKKGCGGSEEAVIQLSKRLVKLGWEVTVYNNCVKEATVDGVKWVRFERFNPRDIFNVIVGWRNNPFLDDVNAMKKFIDMHDVPSLEYFTEESLKDVKVLVKSEYHKSLFNQEDGFKIIPNGIDPDQFKNESKPLNLVWTSSYDRGLEQLLEMWPEIKEEVPEATLDVAYGFELFDASPQGQTPNGKAWRAKMADLLEQDGVTHHGRLSNDAVAELYNKADVWAYPTNFPEISCITAIKAQAASCRILTTNYAALAETVVKDEQDIDITTDEGIKTFKKELIKLLKEPRDEKDLDKVAKQVKETYSWDNIANQWNETL